MAQLASRKASKTSLTSKTSIFLLALLLSLAGKTMAQSGLDARQFKKYWRVESESPDYRVTFRGDTCELLAPKGLTLWRKEKLAADCAVEYDVQVVVEDSTDRLSDMNCFWLASDPAAKDIWTQARWRSGIFTRCYTLQMYYMGYGGNYNTTTRFRRYTGDAQGVDSVTHRPPVLVEYTDTAHLLKANHWYHIRLQTTGGRTQMFVDGERVVDYLDPEPLSEGWFGFRTTLSRTRIAHFRYERMEPMSLRTDIPLHWVGVDTSSNYTTPVTFGIPFAQGELNNVGRLSLSYPTTTDAWVNARWPDGSVKWAAMAATVPVGRQMKVVLTKPTRSKSQTFVTETDRQYIVGGHVLTVYIPKQGEALIDSIVMTGGKMMGAARLTAATTEGSFTGRIDSVRLERSGRELAVIRLDGRHCNGQRAWLPFTVRLYVYNDSRQMKMVHTFVYDGEASRDFITSLGVTFAVPMRQDLYNRHVAFATEQGGVWAEPVQPLDGRRPLTNYNAHRLQMEGRHVNAYNDLPPLDRQLIKDWAAWDGFRLSQLTDNSFSIRKRAFSAGGGSASAGPSPFSAGRGSASAPWIGTFTGTRAPGFVFVGDTRNGLAVGMKDFWQSYPSTIQIDHARSSEALLTMFMWSPEAEPMNLCHYDTVAHGLMASYEDVQPGLSTPYGIARTTTLWIVPQPGYPGKADICRQAQTMDADPRLLPTTEYLHAKRAFGIWSMAPQDSLTFIANSNSGHEAASGEVDRTWAVEHRLAQYLDFYRKAIDQHRWYGFWNYGDLMHAYDPVRHEWRYDVGGYAWDNTELATPMWLWYSFLRTGRADVWRMAEAMTRHNSEVDTYHMGPLAPLGSRHNVSHWGCGAKEARISQAAFLRFYYYLTADDRTGDLMHAQTDADTLLYHLDPMRLAEPRGPMFPCTAPARLRIGPDWLAYAGNWMTEWERTGNLRYREKILAGLQSIAALKNGLFTGNKALGYDPATGIITYEGPADRQNTNHLATIMGGFEMMNELMPMMEASAPALIKPFKGAWLDHALRYKQMAFTVSHNHFPVRRLMAYAAWQTRSPQLAAEAWSDLWGRIEHQEAPAFSITTIQPPQVPAPVDYWQGLTTNDAALWSLDAIYMLETIGEQYPLQ